MKMGIKEFRDRISEVALGDKPVVLTHHGRRVGQYIPDLIRPRTVIDGKAWLDERLATARAWRSSTPDWREKLRSVGTPEDEISALEDDDRCS
jgi:hypothetical protein